MNADDIRAQYVETLARSRYARGRGIAGTPWSESTWAETYLKGAEKDVAVLAAAGLLPTVEECEHFKTNVSAGVVRARRYVTDWRESS
jgi:hypothetical protein